MLLLCILWISNRNTILLRPIVSCINSATYKLSGFIAKILSPLMGNTDSFVMNTGHFVQMMREDKLGPEEMLVSFDVSSLFTNVPIQEAVQVIKKKLKEDQSLPSHTSLTRERITELLEICLITTYFRFQGWFYEQQEGAAMGSPVSAIVANMYMEHFKELALRTAPERPRVWKRYVDDTCCIIKKEAVDRFLKHLNNIRDSIRFTMEEEKDNSLPFLDTLLMRRDDGTIDITVYRKPTHTDTYLDFWSHHPFHIKRGLITCLQHRIDSITSREEYQKLETNRLRRVLRKNGYPTQFVLKASCRRPKNSEKQKPAATVVIPYMQGLSESIRRVCQKYNIRIVFGAGKSLRTILTKAKDRLPQEQQSNVVYKIPCSCGKVYIREMARRMESRMREHRSACRKCQLKKSAVAEHTWTQDHNILWNKAEIIDHAQTRGELAFKEAVQIQLTPEEHLINKDGGAEIPKCWLAMIRNYQCRYQTPPQSTPTPEMSADPE